MLKNFSKLYVSDGAPSQYKNFKNIANLNYHHLDYELTAEWYFFATVHGDVLVVQLNA